MTDEELLDTISHIPLEKRLFEIIRDIDEIDDRLSKIEELLNVR